MGGFWRSASGCTAACRSQIAELRREVVELRRQARYYRRMHGKAVEREQRLKDKLQAARAKLKELRQRLRERWARRRGSEKRTRSAGGTEAAAAPPRQRGQQRGAPSHGRRQHAHLPVQIEEHDVDPDQRRCPACGDEYRAHGSADSEQLEIEVRAYRRVIKRRRYRRSCQCAAAPALRTAPAVPRLIAKGILGISLWVTVLLDKYLLHRPTYRLLEDLRAHGLDLAQGTVTDGLRRLAPLFAPLREALIARSRSAAHWHADETSWQVFEASSEDACSRWNLWVFWSVEVVVFTLDPTRSAQVPKQHFATVTGGVVSVDRYSAYKRLAKDTDLKLSFCWAHLRRDFITVANERDDQEEWAEQWLAAIATLYRMNDERLRVRGEPAQYAVADAELRATVQGMQERWQRELAQQPKLPAACAKVLRSLRNHWDGLTLFVADLDLPLDNNQAERALRGPVVGRKNYYGSGAQWSGELSAALFSLFHTLERWRINPRTWLTEYLSACALAGGQVPEDFERFLPWNRPEARLLPRGSPRKVVESRAA